MLVRRSLVTGCLTWLTLVAALGLGAGCSSSPQSHPDSGTPPAADAGAEAATPPPADAGPDATPPGDAGPDTGGPDATPAADGAPATGDGPPLPPDPATVATPIDPTVPTDIASATAFLYTGDGGIQQGVAPGTIEPQRVVVIRGRVGTRAGDALPGVAITVLDHPELGRTLSRADGAFDLAVNGGGVVTLAYFKDGFLPAQRQVATPWRDFVSAPEVVLVPLDTKVTVVDLTAGQTQVAQGSAVTDDVGTRQATVLLRAGTQAGMTVNGTSSPVTTLSIRATEYTVGAPGPKAMPAVLPPTSGYTYAVELSADEALAAGATAVTFDRPVITYVENFLGFPVGGAVPAGYYDRAAGVWVPAPNGKIIKVLAVTSGAADVDTDGDDVPDDATTLTALGIDADERQRLATLYQPGTSLWRVPVTHFTPWDYNWPYGPPDDARPPAVPAPDPDGVGDPCKKSGSIIGCESQSLGQRLPLAGTPYALHYASDRVAGRKTLAQVRIPLSGASVPASLARIDVTVAVAGQQVKQSFAAAPNQHYDFEWDRTDAYGRAVSGAVPITATIGYVYPAVYRTPAEFAASFGGTSGGGGVIGARAAMEIILTQTWSGRVGGWNVSTELGGWTFTHHHVYDAEARVLHLGTGDTVDSLAPAIARIAGAGVVDAWGGDGGPATAAHFKSPWGIAVAPDGSVYVADTGNCAVRRVDPEGIVNRMVGTYEMGFSGDGGPALDAKLYGPFSLALGPDGSLYILDLDNWRVRRVGPDGIITTVAGTGTRGSTGDGGPATAAMIEPFSIAAGADGSLYLVEAYNHRVRRVAPDGVINTIVGTGTPGFAGDGGPAAAASLNRPWKVAVGRDGSLFIADRDNHRVRRVGVDGIITTVAGSGSTGSTGDGGAAIDAALEDPTALAIGPDDSLYVAQYSPHRVRAVSPDGLISTIAGTGTLGAAGSGGPAAAGTVGYTYDMAVGPDGSLFVLSRTLTEVHAVRQIKSQFPGFSLATRAVPSLDGLELYQFDLDGRHLATYSALTGATYATFGYDAAHRLATVTDGYGAVTTIERDGGGKPTAIVAPLGQRTTLGLDANGYLAAITDPAGGAISFTSTATGLMTGMTDGRSAAYTFQYDPAGRLTKDADPAGGSKTLTRVAAPGDYTVSLTTGLGRTTSFGVTRASTGDLVREVTEPGGLAITATASRAGATTVTWPDGLTLSLGEGPDPRFGMQAPVLTAEVVRTPGGLTATTARARTVTTGSSGELLTLTRTATVNGRTWTSAFDTATRTATTTSPTGRQTAATVDAHQKLVRLAAPGLEAVDLAYDALGRLTAATQGARARAVTYDALGRVTSFTDALAATATFTVDELGRVTEQLLPGTAAHQFAYDGNSNLSLLTPPGRPAHGFSYTPVDLLASYTPPVADGVGTRLTEYTYDLDGALTGMSLPDGTAVTATFDAAGRPATVQTPRTTIQVAYDAAGRVTGLADSAGASLAYQYDGPLATRETWSGAIAGYLTYAYDADFRVVATTVNGGAAVARVYDDDGLLVQAGPLTLARDAASGWLTSAAAGGVATSYTYNAFGEVATLTAVRSSTTLYEEHFVRDALGRISQRTETIGGTTQVYDYGYDAAGRLTSVSTDTTLTASYAYDANGNRTAATGGATVAATYDAQDRLLTRGDLTYTFGPAGELRTRLRSGDAQPTSYTYDAIGNLAAVTLVDGTQVTYVIDAQNRRVGRSVNATPTQRFLWESPLRIAAELDGSGALVSRFVYGTRSNVPEAMVRGGVTYRLVTDRLGSPRLVVNAADGAIAQRLDYDEWGVVVADSNPGFQPFGFAGGLYDPLTGLTRFGTRDYDAAAGRWTARDRMLFDGASLNLYAYANGDPVNFKDPFGMFKIEVSAYDGIGGGVSLTVDGSGFTVCGELGIGAGGGVEVGLFDKVGRTDLTVGAVADASSKFAGDKIGAKVEFTRWRGPGGPCYGLDGEVKAGPLRFKKDLLNGDKGPSVNAKLKLASIEGGPSLGVGVSAKLAAKACGGAHVDWLGLFN